MRKGGRTEFVRVKSLAGEVTHYVAIFSDQSERKAADERIQFLAHFDVLTGLPNRGHLQDRALLAIQNASHDNGKLGVLLLDLDRFKTINESLGHAAGDILLKIASERIRRVLGAGEVVARQGGDEFLVLLPLINDAADAVHVAESILAEFAAPIDVYSHSLAITASIGISLFPDDGRDFDTLVRNADAFLWLDALRARGDYEYRHALSCSALATAFGRHLALPREVLVELATGGFLMDIGMATLPRELVDPSARRSAEDGLRMRDHVAR